MLSPVKIRIFGPKRAKFCPKYALYVISNGGCKISTTAIICSHCCIYVWCTMCMWCWNNITFSGTLNQFGSRDGTVHLCTAVMPWASSKFMLLGLNASVKSACFKTPHLQYQLTAWICFNACFETGNWQWSHKKHWQEDGQHHDQQLIQHFFLTT